MALKEADDGFNHEISMDVRIVFAPALSGS